MAIDDTMFGGGRGKRSEGGPRKSGTRALIFWVVAIAAGGAAAMTLRWYLERSAAPPPAALGKVAVAAMDLPMATTIREEHLKMTDWPANAQLPGSIREPKELIGRVLVAKLVAGEPILTSKLASKEAGQGLAALIPEAMRAMAVRVDDVVGVAGFIHPMDRVDVIVTIKPMKPENAEPTSKVILQNIKVLAVGKEIDTKEQRGKAMPVTVATLLVTPEEAEKLALAANQGRLLLTLRTWTDANYVTTPGMVPTALLADVETAPKSPVAAEERSAPRRSRGRSEPAAPGPVVASPQKETVEILRGDRFEERKFDKDRQQ